MPCIGWLLAAPRDARPWQRECLAVMRWAMGYVYEGWPIRHVVQPILRQVLKTEFRHSLQFERVPILIITRPSLRSRESKRQIRHRSSPPRATAEMCLLRGLLSLWAPKVIKPKVPEHQRQGSIAASRPASNRPKPVAEGPTPQCSSVPPSVLFRSSS